MKKILIVGGTGFLGFHLAKYYLKKNFRVISLSRKKPKKIRHLERVRYIFADISKKKELINALKKIKNINFIVNFGGEVEHKKIKKTLSTHYGGLKNLSNFFIDQKIDKFIQVGSSLEYGETKSPQKESSPLKPRSIYSKAKACSSKYLINMNKKYKFPMIIIRPYQVFGPYQDYNRFIPTIINSCLKNKKFACSNGIQFRDFLYIDDFINCISYLLEKNNLKNNIYNVGSGKPLQIKKIIHLIKKKIKKGLPEFGKIKLRPDESMITYPDISKIKKDSGWKPEILFKEGLNKTINFYRKNLL